MDPNPMDNISSGTDGSNSIYPHEDAGMDMNIYDNDALYFMPPMGPETEAVHVIYTYLFPVIMLVGIVGTALVIPALYVISMRTWSTTFYLCLLSIIDLLILLVRCGNEWYLQITFISLSERIMNSSDALCKTYMFVFNFVLHLSPWLMVAVAIEMTIAARWPHRLYIMCTLERANNVVMLLVIIIVCLDINYFWTWGVPSAAVGCRHTEEFSREFRDTIWPAMTNMVQFVTPLIIVSVCFIVTMATVLSRRPHQEKQIEQELKKYFLELTTLRDFRTICLILCLVFVCCTFFSVTLNLVDFLEVKGYMKLEDDNAFFRYMSIMDLLKALDMTFHALFYSMKVFLYVGYSSTFRATLRQGFATLKRYCKQKSINRRRNIKREHPPSPLLGGGEENSRSKRKSDRKMRIGVEEEEIGGENGPRDEDISSLSQESSTHQNQSGPLIAGGNQNLSCSA